MWVAGFDDRINEFQIVSNFKSTQVSRQLGKNFLSKVIKSPHVYTLSGQKLFTSVNGKSEDSRNIAALQQR